MFKLFSIVVIVTYIVSISAANEGWKAVRPYRDALTNQFNVLNDAVTAIPSTGGTVEQAEV